MIRYRHRKRRTIYEVLTTSARLQCSTVPDVEKRFAHQEWTVYRDAVYDRIYLRPTAEFLDGRFELLSSEATDVRSL